jgi:hypothetical protein
MKRQPKKPSLGKLLERCEAAGIPTEEYRKTLAASLVPTPGATPSGGAKPTGRKHRQAEERKLALLESAVEKLTADVSKLEKATKRELARRRSSRLAKARVVQRLRG